MTELSLWPETAIARITIVNSTHIITAMITNTWQRKRGQKLEKENKQERNRTAFDYDDKQRYVRTPAALAVKIPEKMTFEEAATIPATFLTAMYALYYLARVGKGETVLIHAAAGGVGMTIFFSFHLISFFLTIFMLASSLVHGCEDEKYYPKRIKMQN